MKKLIFSSLILGSALALASCSADEPGMVKNDGPVTLTVQLPGELATRFADGSEVNLLYYTVFQNGNALVTDVLEWVNPANPLRVSLDLIPTQEYDVVFFACSSDITTTLADGKVLSTGYGYNPETAELRVNYEAIAVNNEDFDAFYTKATVSTTTDTTNPIELKRPFAQVNIGTNDLNKKIVTAYGLANYSTTFNIKPENLASGLSLLDGNYTPATAKTGSDYAVTLTVDGLSRLSDKFPVENYDYLDMVYLLVNDGGAQALLNAEFNVNIKDSEDPIQTIDLSSLPAKANYQTNVYGSLLTQSKDFSVALSADFDGIANVDAWDGETYTTYTNDDFRTNAPDIQIDSAADLAGFVKFCSNKDSEFHCCPKIFLNTDIDFKNLPIEGLGTKQIYDLKFEGNNHYIYNLNINNANEYTGLFPTIVNGNIQNLNFVGANVTSTKRAGVLCGNAQNITLNNINVYNSTVNGDKKVAAVIGYCQGASLVTFKNVNVKNITLNAKNGQAAALTGYVSYGVFTDCTATDVKITAGAQTPENPENTFAEYGSGNLVGVMGTNRNPNSLTFTGCSYSDCTLTYTGTDSAVQAEFEAAANRVWGGSSNATGTITVNGVVEYSK